MKFYMDFYYAFEDAVLDSIESHMAFTLTGGYDTRVIAGILRAHEIKLPSVCFGNKYENMIAQRVAKACGLKGFYVDYPNFWYAARAYNHLISRRYKYLLSALYMDEINGSYTGNFIENGREFRILQLKSVWHQDENLLNLQIRFNGPTWITPILEPTVIEALEKIPYRYRVAKQIQRWILKHLFPDLWKIPYANSFMPTSVPYPLHLMAMQWRMGNPLNCIRAGVKTLKKLWHDPEFCLYHLCMKEG